MHPIKGFTKAAAKHGCKGIHPTIGFVFEQTFANTAIQRYFEVFFDSTVVYIVVEFGTVVGRAACCIWLAV